MSFPSGHESENQGESSNSTPFHMTSSSMPFQASEGLMPARATLSPSPESDSNSSLMSLNQSDTISSSSSNPSSVSTCPHCYSNTRSPVRNGSPTHPISLPNPHIDVTTFKDNVNAALEGRFHSGSYDSVTALLLNWKENDMGPFIREETRNLGFVLENVFHFTTTYLEIPSRSPQTKLQRRLSAEIDNMSDEVIDGEKGLLIVYYNGHGVMEDGRLILAARRRWNLQSKTHPALEWYHLQYLLEQAASNMDVLLVLDCCFAAGAVSKGSNGTMEVLAACSRESTAAAPGGSSVPGSPFTQSLIQHLRGLAADPRGVLISELHLHLSRDKILDQQSPNHIIIMGHYNPIVLKPLQYFPDSRNSSFPLTPGPDPGPSSYKRQSLQALMAVSFRGNAFPDVEQFVQYLTTRYPAEVERISIEAVLESCSTLIILRLPSSIWARLPDNSSCQLIGFVKSGNQLLKPKVEAKIASLMPAVDYSSASRKKAHTLNELQLSDEIPSDETYHAANFESQPQSAMKVFAAQNPPRFIEIYLGYLLDEAHWTDASFKQSSNYTNYVSFAWTVKNRLQVVEPTVRLHWRLKDKGNQIVNSSQFTIVQDLDSDFVLGRLITVVHNTARKLQPGSGSPDLKADGAAKLELVRSFPPLQEYQNQGPEPNNAREGWS